MEFELLLREAAVAAGDALAIEIDEGVDSVVQPVLRLRSERVCRLHDVVKVPVLQFGVGYLVILLDDLAETGIVELDVGLEVGELNVEIRYASLEK